jgi:vancomycin resistance protein VanW
VLPWGVGCSIVYNYVDLVVRNDTDATFQILVSVGERHLEGDLRADRELAYSYRVHARDEEFLRYGGEHYRRNEIWRTVVDRRTGESCGQELVKKNCALVKYFPSGVDVVDLGGPA